MKPILQIVIPTFNRKEYLVQTLNMIYESIGKSRYRDAVVVYVIDNHSTDGTHEVLEEFSTIGLKYQINPENVGLINNINIAYHTSLAPWSWPLGDDDFILPQAIDTICDYITSLQDTNVDLFFINYGQSNKDGSSLYSNQVALVQGGTRWRFGSGLENIPGLFDLLGFIGASVFRVESMLRTGSYWNCGSYYDFIGNLLELASDSEVGVIGPGILTQRQHNQRENLWVADQRWSGVNGFEGLLKLFNTLIEKNFIQPSVINAISSKKTLNNPTDASSFCGSISWYFDAFVKNLWIDLLVNGKEREISDRFDSWVPLLPDSDQKQALTQFALKIKETALCRDQFLKGLNELKTFIG